MSKKKALVSKESKKLSILRFFTLSISAFPVNVVITELLIWLEKLVLSFRGYSKKIQWVIIRRVQGF